MNVFLGIITGMAIGAVLLLANGAFARECLSPDQARAQYARLGSALAEFKPHEVESFLREYNKPSTFAKGKGATNWTADTILVQPGPDTFIFLFEDGCHKATLEIPYIQYLKLLDEAGAR